MIKIDKVFLKGIISDDDGKNGLLKAIVGIANNLDYAVIAEGVEEKIQADHLLALGCNMMQGYLFGKPMREEDFLNFLHQKDQTDS
jgi:EAL domain-containing protein (putative c-di-GMP-specific phosphodiesterase class I)